MLESVLEASKGRYIIQNITDYRIENILLLATHARDSGATHVFNKPTSCLQLEQFDTILKGQLLKKPIC
jgi:hypothetical protein